MIAVGAGTISDYNYPVLQIAGFHRGHCYAVVCGYAHGDYRVDIECAQRAIKCGTAESALGCFVQYDLPWGGLQACYDLVLWLSCNVVGGFDGAVLMASSISQKFSIVTVVPSVVPMLASQARDLGISGNLASIRNVNMPVQDLGDKTKLIAHLLEQSKLAIQNDGAQAIVLGCTGMVDVVDAVSQELKLAGLPAPVIDPSYAAITLLQSLIRCGLSQSRLTYYASTAKLVTDPNSCIS